MATDTLKDDKIQLRISKAEKKRLAEAAKLTRRSLSDFVVDSALTQADETLADRHSFVLTADQMEDFIAALDAPTKPLNPRMAKLLSEPSILEK